ncbi:MAG: hypothetical protein KDA24_22975 [Deltaproteobacteria bacterium]|nr:hypothetical protein [Deltaproteobacteria bacterium]
MSRLSSLLLVLPALLLLGCPSEGEPEPATDLSYYADIKPMLDTHCTRCHQPGGQGVGDFTDDVEAMALADRMRARVDAGEMPPPVADPSCRDYEGSEHLSMPDHKRAMLAEWVDGGKPMGELAEYTPVGEVIAQLDRVDMTIGLEYAYTPTFTDASNPGNEYRCFVVEHGQTEDFFLTGMNPLIDSEPLVHHIVLFKMPREEIWDDYDPAVGKDCIDGTGGADVDGMIAGWAPGALPVALPEGMGLRVNEDDVLVMQMHYFQAGPEVAGLSDQSGYEFTIADSVDTPIRMLPAGIFDFNIPAGAESHTATDSISLPEDIGLTVYGTFPHMHVLGTQYRVWADQDGVETCISEGDYDFDNQITYMFKEPLDFPAGSDLNISCTWNNSTSNPDLLVDPPVDTGYGERTDEEMCFAFTLAAIRFE